MARTREVLGNIKKGSTVGIFIGPEGGFASSEIDQVKDEMEIISLGNRIPTKCHFDPHPAKSQKNPAPQEISWAQTLPDALFSW
mgnify:CR=1 FL=1